MKDNRSSQAGRKVYHIRVSAEEAGGRLDRLLADHVTSSSRARLKTLIESGHVALTRAGARPPPLAPALKVRQGDEIEIRLPPPAPAEPEAEAIPLAILYEDADLIVIDKPAGLVVHPAPGNPRHTLVNALIAHCGESLSGIGGVRRPGIVHRLDKDTSGIIVAAKTDAAHRGLGRQFAAHSITRVYLAIIWGRLVPAVGLIEGAIGRDPKRRTRMAVIREGEAARGARPARTRYRVVRPLGSRASLVECRIETGRTHQVRVHLASRGSPIIGDPVYGRGRTAPLDRLADEARQTVANFRRQALHAHVLGFTHPTTGLGLRFESPLPADMQALAYALEGF